MVKMLDNDVLEVYRVCPGVLVKIYKCRFFFRTEKDLRDCEDYDKKRSFNSKYTKNIGGECYIITKDVQASKYKHREPYVINAGLYIVEDSLCEKIEDTSKWHIEIKTSGTSFSGSPMEMQEYLNEIIEKIKQKY